MRIAAIVFFSTLMFLSVFGPFLIDASATQMNVASRFLPPIFMEGGQYPHLLGTDQLGRDLLLRSLIGLRNAFAIGLISVIGMFVTWLRYRDLCWLSRRLDRCYSDAYYRCADVDPGNHTCNYNSWVVASISADHYPRSNTGKLAYLRTCCTFGSAGRARKKNMSEPLKSSAQPIYGSCSGISLRPSCLR